MTTLRALLSLGRGRGGGVLGGEHWFGSQKSLAFGLAQPRSSQVALSRYLQNVVSSSSVKVSARLCGEERREQGTGKDYQGLCQWNGY